MAKVSEITVSDIANYLRLTEVSEADEKFITDCLAVAKEYIKNYTGLEELDDNADFVIAVYLLCQDMYDNRSLVVDNTNMNKVVTTILDLHSNDLLPSVGDEDD